MPHLIYWHKRHPNKSVDCVNWFWTGEEVEDYPTAVARCEELARLHGNRFEPRWLTPAQQESGKYPPVSKLRSPSEITD